MATVAPVLPLPQSAPPATTAGAAVTRGVGNDFRDMVAEATDREPAAQPTRDASAPQRTENFAPDGARTSGLRSSAMRSR